MARWGFFRWLSRGLLTVCCLSAGGPAWAQTASEQAVKAGFLFNFVKFTQWNVAREGDRNLLVICTPGQRLLDGQFTLLQGRPVGARTIQIRTGVQPADWRACDLLYLTQEEADRVDVILRTVAALPVLTVGDFPDFVRMGGMIGLRLEDSKMRFDVNLAAVERTGLLLNSQMVQLAGRVIR